MEHSISNITWTKTRRGNTKIGIISWYSKGAGHVWTYAGKSGFFTHISLDDIEISKGVIDKLELSEQDVLKFTKKELTGGENSV